ncbi:Mss4-like protein [Phialemonium atrogriseum]|uniref:Mss4-like protein n=1 Tax=Phialemonium atrogriseum TaxID=1093897 RepID=A0AAJ0FIJ3_9PEZI|nr:Mss4-like protein [Phialemonium atrogriseum]KAK1763364.1 Mss4-like protein [Phialemonium atrogriseum]
MAPETSESVEITARCLCGAHSFTTSVPRSDLPLKASACHCTSCRHTTGALHTTDAPWPGPADAIRRSTTLSRYVFGARVHVLFCGTCSTPLFFEEFRAGPGEPGELGVFTGALGNNALGGDDGKRLVSVVDHIFVGDTIDGGASVWLRETGDGAAGRATRWFGGRGEGEEVPEAWPPVSSLPGADVRSEVADVPVRCRCRGVDLVFRHGEHLAEFEGMSRAELPWFVDPVTHKTFAGFEGCDSCRLSLGADVIHWTFVMLRHLAFSEGTGRQDLPAFPRTAADLNAAVSAQNRDPRLGTLSLYASSPDVQRYFCSRCSATVFYACDDRQDYVDVAIGLLDAPDGARAESILSWSFGSTPSWLQDVAGGWRDGLFTDIVKEAEKWRVERGYPKNWRRVELEEAEKKTEK